MLTAGQAISRADEIKQNDCGISEKLEVLYGLDRRITSEIVLTHEQADGENAGEFPAGYAEESPLLFGDHPEMYVLCLLCAVDLHCGDLARYNNDAGLFNAAYEAFRNEYNRTHKAKSVKLRY